MPETGPKTLIEAVRYFSDRAACQVAVAPFHLFRYLDEETWRFNERDTNDGGRFARIMRGVTGRRLTYRELCAIDDCGFMGIK